MKWESNSAVNLFKSNRRIKTMIKHISLAFALVLFTVACGEMTDGQKPIVEPKMAPEVGLDEVLKDVASTTYSLDKSHAFLTFKVTHANGLSKYRMSFSKFDVNLKFNSDNPESSIVMVSIDPTSVVTNYTGNYKAGHPNSKFKTWDEDVIRNERWLNSDNFPKISFVSTSAVRTGNRTGKVTGDLTLLGVTAPVTLDVTFNGAKNFQWLGERDVLGFNAVTIFKRSEFGMGAFVPYIGDEVSVEFTGEFVEDE